MHPTNSVYFFMRDNARIAPDCCSSPYSIFHLRADRKLKNCGYGSKHPDLVDELLGFVRCSTSCCVICQNCKKLDEESESQWVVLYPNSLNPETLADLVQLTLSNRLNRLMKWGTRSVPLRGIKQFFFIELIDKAAEE